MTVAGQAFANASSSRFQAKNEGYIEEVLTSPLRSPEIVASYLAGGFARGSLAAAAIALPFSMAAPAGRRRDRTGAHRSRIQRSRGVTGLYADSFDEHAFVANLVISPLALVGRVFYSVDWLSEPWATLTRVGPIDYLADASRSGLTGVQENSLTASLPVAAGVAIGAAAVALLGRGWRLRRDGGECLSVGLSPTPSYARRPKSVRPECRGSYFARAAGVSGDFVPRNTRLLKSCLRRRLPPCLPVARAARASSTSGSPRAQS